jgi:predicted enzyme related to lactoylglutathione lyase
MLSTSYVNFAKMLKFYKDVVGLKVDFEGEYGEKEQFASFKIGKDNLYLNTHSKISGKNKEPARYMINIEVDDIKMEVARLKRAKVKVVSPIYHMEGYGYIATFADPDGNYFQFVQVRTK